MTNNTALSVLLNVHQMSPLCKKEYDPQEKCGVIKT